MVHPLFWPGTYFFYPIGNTPAVCLTRDIAPEEPANILALGCGDPKNIMYTIMCEPRNMKRRLDFTCCDIDAAILARNVILFTMVVDNVPQATLWNIFFHLRLDDASHSTMVKHCHKLIEVSDNLQSWHASFYGSFIRMCTEYTLVEVRRHWLLYARMHSLPQEQINNISAEFASKSRSISQQPNRLVGYNAARSAGPLMPSSMEVFHKQYDNYWEQGGVTFTDAKQAAAAALLNPTFVYSLAGSRFSVHYGTDPMAPFHFSALCGNAKDSVSIPDLVEAAHTEFQQWCSTLRGSILTSTSTSPIIRLFLGEAMMVCRALNAFAITQTLRLGVPVAQWNAQRIQLERDEYLSGGAPTRFNVIDTSNLEDHVGLMNILLTSVPLLSMPLGVLYTESLLFYSTDATQEFKKIFHVNLAMASLLFGIYPVDYLSGFTTRSNSHELLVYQALKELKLATQYHKATTWKSPTSGDFLAIHSNLKTSCSFSFEPSALGTFLFDVYKELFQPYNPMEKQSSMRRQDSETSRMRFGSSNMVHYVPEGFVLFLKLVQTRLEMPDERWREMMTRFMFLAELDHKLPTNSGNYHDLCAQLHRHGVHTVPIYNIHLSKIGRFLLWDSVPPLVRIILTVPRKKLQVLDDSDSKTPPLHCNVRGNRTHNIFSSVDVVYGSVMTVGTKTNPKVTFIEDKEGNLGGSSSLIASFVMPTYLLTSFERQEDLRVYLSLRTTQGTVSTFTSKLGMYYYLDIFGASLLDESSVHVLPEHVLPSRTPCSRSSLSESASPPTVVSADSPRSPLLAQIGHSDRVVIELDEQCEIITSLTLKFFVETADAQHLFASGTLPQVLQVSPCVMRVSIGSLVQHVVYPIPIIGSESKLWLARKPIYIEVVVPISAPFTKPDGMKHHPFPVVTSSDSNLHLWNIHRVNLESFPVVNNTSEKIARWLNPHVASAMSAREHSNRAKKINDVLMFVKDTLHTVFMRSAGTQGGEATRLFCLREHASPTKDCDTVFFISDLKYDQHSHTVICDGYVLTLTPELMAKIPFGKLLNEAKIVHVAVFEGEMKAWKQLLPALAERCRTTWTHGVNCEYISQGRIPLADEMGHNPLCSCGTGKEVDGMKKIGLWSIFAPYVTRIALSPLFAVSYMEAIVRDPTKHKCSVCRQHGKPKLMACGKCKKVRYCSEICQKRDWNAHKPRCIF